MPDSSIAGTLFAGAVPAIPLDASYYQLKQRVDHKGRPKGKPECGHWHFVTSWLTQQQFEQLTHYALSNTACFDAHAEYGRSDGLGAFVTVWGTGCYLVGWREEFDARGTNGQEASHRVHLTLSPQEMGRQAGAKGEFIAPQSRDYPYAGAAAGGMVGTSVAAGATIAASSASRIATKEEAYLINSLKDKFFKENRKIQEGANVAIAKGEIDGKLINLVANSSKATAGGTVPHKIPRNQILKTQPTDNDIARGRTHESLRAYDSEVKILEYILDNTTPESIGSISIVSLYDFCSSCENAIDIQMKYLRPGINIDKAYVQPYKNK